MAESISVSQLKCACLDPQWKNQWIQGKNPSTMSFSPLGTIPVYGAVFHKIAEKFVNWLTKIDNKSILAELSDEYSLWHKMYNDFAEVKLNKLLEKNKIESAYYLSQSLKSFCRRLDDLRCRTLNFSSWQDIFLTQEFLIQNIRFNTENSFIVISGQVDAVRTHPEYGLEIVDYKLSRGTSMKHDLVQLSIYSQLLSKAKPGLRFHGILEYYEPELHEVSISEKELEQIFNEIVYPVLHELTNGKSISKDMSKDIEDCYASFNLKVNIIDKIQAPQLVRYKTKPAPGVKVVSLANRAADLQVFLSLRELPIIEPAQGCVHIDIPKDKPDTVFWQDIINRSEYKDNKSPVSFPVGLGVNNKLIIADLADSNMCHALIAGSSGSGKSEFLKSLVASLIAKNNPGTLKLSIIDPKILTFGSFSNCSFLTGPIITDIFSAIPCLTEAVNEMESRYCRLGSEGFENLNARFQSGKHDIPFYVIIFDEFADLILAGKEEKKTFEALTARLAAKGRAAGIHLVLTTQRPDRTIVTGLIKANLPLKICLKVTTAGNSHIIIDKNGGESLLGCGDLLCCCGKDIERGQSPYITQEELFKLAGTG
ncbi:DNA translocase domain-containing protein, FtsK-like [Desulfonema limicola]|uniref:DNA translocase domain-containing protein, FtsK-like n=1 Tax=Desulfonema limicola TaxID=45656 RepID=A0A975B7X1_9BACT|nr:DNA translocase FtsK [Desulfonema limicola]QTA80527.1 DNA translocase domain-containing protein, FtsK-like [Desulfonema limicola]